MSPGSRSEISREISRLRARGPALQLRAKVLQALRTCLCERGYLEVETPHILPSPAPERYIDPIPLEKGYLHTSPEICMKRLFAAGYNRIFQICKCFRKAERGSKHLPEFTMLEWYRAGIDYQGLMEECETLIYEVIKRIGAQYRIVYGGKEIDLRPPWQRLSVKQAFRRYAGMDVGDALKRRPFEELLVENIEPYLGRGKPTFLYDFPGPMAAMARRRHDAPWIEERFEVYVAGIELANGFSELNDAREQRRRLEEEMDAMRQMGKETFPLPERFLVAVDYMPDGAGIALGIDRLIMLLADKPDIKDVVAFTPEEL